MRNGFQKSGRSVHENSSSNNSLDASRVEIIQTNSIGDGFLWDDGSGKLFDPCLFLGGKRKTGLVVRALAGSHHLDALNLNVVLKHVKIGPPVHQRLDVRHFPLDLERTDINVTNDNTKSTISPKR